MSIEINTIQLGKNWLAGLWGCVYQERLADQAATFAYDVLERSYGQPGFNLRNADYLLSACNDARNPFVEAGVFGSGNDLDLGFKYKTDKSEPIRSVERKDPIQHHFELTPNRQINMILILLAAAVPFNAFMETSSYLKLDDDVELAIDGAWKCRKPVEPILELNLISVKEAVYTSILKAIEETTFEQTNIYDLYDLDILEAIFKHFHEAARKGKLLGEVCFERYNKDFDDVRHDYELLSYYALIILPVLNTLTAHKIEISKIPIGGQAPVTYAI